MDTKILEESLLKDGYEKESVCIHIAEYDKSLECGARRLSYDIGKSCDCVDVLKNFAEAVNKRFPNIKMFVEGGEYVIKGSGTIEIESPETIN